MRILQQCIYFPPEVGGLESHVYYLCRELVRLGDEVTIVTSRSKPESAVEERVVKGLLTPIARADGSRGMGPWMEVYAREAAIG
jgi:hypothetical protein